MDLLASGKRDKAVDEARKCVSITPFMAHRVILEIRRLQRSNPSVWNKVKYLVAPYEADAQLCFMQKEGLIDAILTEDSDLIAVPILFFMFFKQLVNSIISISSFHSLVVIMSFTSRISSRRQTIIMVVEEVTLTQWSPRSLVPSSVHQR